MVGIFEEFFFERGSDRWHDIIGSKGFLPQLKLGFLLLCIDGFQ